MFGSGFSLGFAVSDLQLGISSFIGLAPVVAIIVGVLVLAFVPVIVRALRSVLNERPDGLFGADDSLHDFDADQAAVDDYDYRSYYEG